MYCLAVGPLEALQLAFPLLDLRLLVRSVNSIVILSPLPLVLCMLFSHIALRSLKYLGGKISLKVITSLHFSALPFVIFRVWAEFQIVYLVVASAPALVFSFEAIYPKHSQ